MRKIYSLVLMATMLLIGTNAWGAIKTLGDPTVTPGTYDYETLKAAFAGADSGDTIRLETNITTSDCAWFGTQYATEDGDTLTLDLNGKEYIFTPENTSNANSWHVGIALSHGKLTIMNSKTVGQLLATNGASMISVYGTYDKGEDNNARTSNKHFSHLIVEENVLITTHGNASGINVDVLRHNCYYNTSNDEYSWPGYDSEFLVSYGTDVYNAGSNYGVAHGVRVDLFGHINSAKYGVKVNGKVRHPFEFITPEDEDYSKGTVKANSVSPVVGGSYAPSTYAIAYSDTAYMPYVYIHKSAVVEVSQTGKKATAIYSSGSSRFRIEGYCTGNIGLYAKSGTIEIVDAVIESTNATYTPVTSNGTLLPSGIEAGGSAIIIDSEEIYAGFTSVVISGDSKISAESGYAIAETVPEVDVNTKVENIIINGGTIEGGAQGAIIVSEKSVVNATTDVVIYGANVGGDVIKNDEQTGVAVGGYLDNLIPNNTDYHTTPVTTVDPETGNEKTVIVVSKGGKPADEDPENPGQPTPWSWCAGQSSDDPENLKSVAWTLVDPNENAQILSGNTVILDELQINSGYKDGDPGEEVEHLQQLVINNGATLQVERLIMNSYARIIVKAGGKLIVKGSQGISAPNVKNITLEASEADGQALFLIHPNVASNRHPNATVQLTSKAFYDEEHGKYIWQRFGVPSYTDTLKRTDVDYNHTTYPTAWQKIDHQDWVNFPATEKMKPFVCYGMTTSSTTANGVYQFMCPLMGNENVTLPLTDQWNYYANSYMAPIDIKKLIANLKDNNDKNVSGTIYLYKPSNNWWYEINNTAYVFDALKQTPELPTVVNPMQAFVLERVKAEGANPVINYKNQVYDPVVDPTASAPARSRNSVSAAMIEIMAADGTTDCVRMLEDAQFSAEFDNSYDAHKFMNENSFNLFAGENLSIIATDNLEGTVLSLNTKEQTSFTLTISLATGMDYAIRDNLTGTEIAMVEGATYMFSTAANANVEGRFEIVPVAKMPTAIENIEETAAVKGIYTVTGQFVGNDYHSLPNGIYVIDGKKIVK